MICVYLSSDFKVLITLLTGGSPDSSLQGIVHDLGMLSNSLNYISFKFVPRQCNVAADRLAKDALFQLSSPSFREV